MSAPIFTIDDWKREKAARLAPPVAEPAPEAAPGSLLAIVPPDAPMDDATITAWNGERFVRYEQWLATVPIEQDPMPPPLAPAASLVVAATCNGTRVRLVKEGERWLIFIGASKATGRRRDFASPFLEHAIRTAELWYGPAADGWRTERKPGMGVAVAPTQTALEMTSA